MRDHLEAVKVSNESPVLLDRFLNDALEVDVDAISDGEKIVIDEFINDDKYAKYRVNPNRA